MSNPHVLLNIPDRIATVNGDGCDLTFSGCIVDAAEAPEFNMALEVAAHDLLMERARERAAVIALKSPRLSKNENPTTGR